MVKCRLLLLLDRFLEFTDGLRTRNLDGEGMLMIIALNPAPQLEHIRHGEEIQVDSGAWWKQGGLGGGQNGR